MFEAIKRLPLSFVELPEGIFTSDGFWFHTSTSDLEQFSPETLQKVGLSDLLQKAGDWSKLPITLSLWVLPLFLASFELWQAITLTLFVYVSMAVMTPSVVIYGATRAVNWLNNPIVQGLFYVTILSYFAQTEAKYLLLAGLIGFVLFRWHIITKLSQPLVDVLRKPLSSLPVHDQILRNLIVRAAQKFGAPLAELDRMEKRVLEIMHYRRKKK